MGNGGQTGKASLGQKVHAFALAQFGQQVGTGECFDLADKALQQAGAKSAADYGKITANADYKWGTPVNTLKAQPGDIVQFRDYKVKIVVKTTTTVTSSTGTTVTVEEREEETSRPHHTAVVSSATGGVFVVYEQNVAPPGKTQLLKKVQKTTLPMSDKQDTKTDTSHPLGGGTKKVEVKTSIKVSGKIWVYRPQAK